MPSLLSRKKLAYIIFFLLANDAIKTSQDCRNRPPLETDPDLTTPPGALQTRFMMLVLRNIVNITRQISLDYIVLEHFIRIRLGAE
jgi:hypothetical protein